MKTSAKNLTHSPALVFFLIMGIRELYTLSVIFTHVLPKTGQELDWSILSSIISPFIPFIVTAALFLRIPNLLYVSGAVSIVLILCSTVLEFAEWFAVGYVAGAEILLLPMYLIQISLHLSIIWMIYRFGQMKKLWFLPLSLYLVRYIIYIIYLLIIIYGNSTMSPWSHIFNLGINVPAYGFLGYWLANPYKRSYLLKMKNTSEQEENTHA